MRKHLHLPQNKYLLPFCHSERILLSKVSYYSVQIIFHLFFHAASTNKAIARIWCQTVVMVCLHVHRYLTERNWPGGGTPGPFNQYFGATSPGRFVCVTTSTVVPCSVGKKGRWKEEWISHTTGDEKSWRVRYILVVAIVIVINQGYWNI